MDTITICNSKEIEKENMTKTQIQLQNALHNYFLANLAFLSEFDNKLYHRVE